jgi:UDP-N-acetylglucosamine/UDP-N-acetylgalactosamine diphosphorylase
MEIDSTVQQRLTNANQAHLVAYWSELNDDQRKILLDDISEVDFDRIQQAYDGIKHELLAETNGDTKDKTPEVIDDIVEPIPDHMAGSIDEASNEQLENYRQQGLKAVSEGSVCVLLLAGGQGTRLGMIFVFLKLFLWIVL